MTSKPTYRFNLTALDHVTEHADLIDVCQFGLRELGYDVRYQDNQLDAQAINIIFDASSRIRTWAEMKLLANDIIFYNTSVVTPSSLDFTQSHLRLLQNAHVWDVCQHNVNELKQYTQVQDIHYVPMGYSPNLTRHLPPQNQFIDVLCVGKLTERQMGVVRELRALKLNVVTELEIGRIDQSNRDELIQCSKILLNVYASDAPQVFELTKTAYWFANHKAIVSEVSANTDIEPRLKTAIASATIDSIAQTCYELVHDPVKRQILEHNACQALQSFDATNILKVAIDRYLSQKKPHSYENSTYSAKFLPLPKTLQVGSGSISLVDDDQWHYDNLNADSCRDYAPDILLDLAQVLHFGERLDAGRFGSFLLQPKAFDKIIAKKYFHRVPDLHLALSNCLALLRDGGILELTVPLNLSYSAWLDSDTCRVFNANTWQNIVNDWWLYGWTESRFEMVNSDFSISDDLKANLGNEYGHDWFAEHDDDWPMALLAPRVVDYQHVVLRKIALTAEEQNTMQPHARFMD